MNNTKEQIINIAMNNKSHYFSRNYLRNKINNYDEKEFQTALSELINEEIFVIEANKKMILNNNYNVFVGKLIKNKNDINCIKTSAPYEKVKINDKLEYSMIGDRVIVDTNTNKVISILERGVQNLIGTYIPSDRNGIVIPDKELPDIYIKDENKHTAKPYDKVIVNIIKYPKKGCLLEGSIEQVIGLKSESEVELQDILNEFGIIKDFPAKVIAQVEKIPEDIPINELNKRLDLTALDIFTIDGEDAKDLDDATSIEKLSDGSYKLGVHIADVSHFVEENSKLDKEAFKRGTSVYFINKVIPMLPKKISNNLCSLNPNEIKLTLSVFMIVDKNGTVLSHSIHESYIKSKARLCYDDVSDFLLNGKELDCNEKVKESLKIAYELALILINKSKESGKLEFYERESKIELDKNDNPTNISSYKRQIANELIEVFMIITNETIAKHYFEINVPFVYRIHESAKEEKIATFIEYVKVLGYKSTEISEILKEAKNKPEEKAINLLLLQCMQQAKYSATEIGHYGLALEYYSHFTSPIRRYPDLQIHRIIKDYLNGRLNSNRIELLKKIVIEASNNSSKKERQAQNSEIEYDKIKKAEYMQDKQNEIYKGLITDVNAAGFTVTLDNTIEGFLSINKINLDKFTFHKELHSYIGDKSKKQLRLGDYIYVQVSEVCMDSKTVMFNFLKYS